MISSDVDLAVVPVRTWSDAGVTSLQALQAPFLIDNDALLTAVTGDDALVQPLLDGMQEQGLVGLAVWPEGLRHPLAFEQNGAPLLSPDDFKRTRCLVARDFVRGFERRVSDDGDAHWEVLLNGVTETLPVSRRQQFIVREVGRELAA